MNNHRTHNIDFPRIQPLENLTDRPFWSVMIPSYNGARFLMETLERVLSQAPDAVEMHIEVVDDNSEDDSERIVKFVGKGRVAFHRNTHRLGLIGNWNACLERALGQWVHVLHQDDLILENFYTTMKGAICANRDIGAIFCRNQYIDESGHVIGLSNLERESAGILENCLERIAVVQLIQFPSMVVKRSVYEELGGFCAKAHYAADWEMWKRIARYYPVCYVPDILASYRLHTGSETSRLVNSGKNLADIRTSIAISKSYLPEQSVEKWSSQALEYCALLGSANAHKMVIDGHWLTGMIQIREALQTCCSVRVLQSLFPIIISGLRAALKSSLNRFNNHS